MTTKIDALIEYATRVGWQVSDTSPRVLRRYNGREHVILLPADADPANDIMERLYHRVRASGERELVDAFDHRAKLAPPPGLTQRVEVPPEVRQRVAMSGEPDGEDTEWIGLGRAEVMFGLRRGTLTRLAMQGDIHTRPPITERAPEGHRLRREVNVAEVMVALTPEAKAERQARGTSPDRLAKARAAFQANAAERRAAKAKAPNGDVAAQLSTMRADLDRLTLEVRALREPAAKWLTLVAMLRGER